MRPPDRLLRVTLERVHLRTQQTLEGYLLKKWTAGRLAPAYGQSTPDLRLSPLICLWLPHMMSLLAYCADASYRLLANEQNKVDISVSAEGALPGQLPGISVAPSTVFRPTTT